MIEVSIDSADIRTWLVCETGQRWTGALRRFAPGLMPAPLVPSVVSTDPAATIDQVISLRRRRAIVLWESREASLLPVCDGLIQAARANPRLLQLVAAPERSHDEQSILLELPAATIVRHPEDLPGLKSMIESYFRRDR